jgi:phosphate transport system substrate-binding protein
VKTLELSSRQGEPAVTPSAETVISGSYPMARPLYLYTVGEATGPTKEFLDWVLGANGQQIVRDLGFVPVPPRPEGAVG